MNKKILILIICVLLLLVGCHDEATNFSTKAKDICNDVCINEGLSQRLATGRIEKGLYCHCERIIKI